MTSIRYDYFKESGGSDGGLPTRTIISYKRFIYVGTLLAILIYGSSFLITTIENFTLKFESQSISSIDSFKGERPDYASPSLKSTDFKGKILFERSL